MYIRVIKDMYKRGRTSVRMLGGATNDFYVSLHQGSALSSFVFSLIMDELTKGI